MNLTEELRSTRLSQLFAELASESFDPGTVRGRALTAELAERVEYIDEDEMVDAVLGSDALADAVEECLDSRSRGLVSQEELEQLQEQVELTQRELRDKADSETLRDLAERVTMDIEEEFRTRLEAMERVMHGGLFRRLKWALTGK